MCARSSLLWVFLNFLSFYTFTQLFPLSFVHKWFAKLNIYLCRTGLKYPQNYSELSEHNSGFFKDKGFSHILTQSGNLSNNVSYCYYKRHTYLLQACRVMYGTNCVSVPHTHFLTTQLYIDLRRMQMFSNIRDFTHRFLKGRFEFFLCLLPSCQLFGATTAEQTLQLAT